MKNNKGFTLIELIVVIVILGIIITIATMSITNYRRKADEDEKLVLRETLIAEFNNYRIDNGINENNFVSIFDSSNDSLIGIVLDKNLSYNTKKCTNITGTNIKFVKKGSIDNSSSLEEVFCVKFYCNGELVINDYDTEKTYCIE